MSSESCWSWLRQPQQSRESSVRYWNWVTGLLFIFIVTIVWTAASYLTRFIYQDLNFQSPFLFTYFSSSFFVLYLPLWQLWVQFGWVVNPPSRHRVFDPKTSERSPQENVCTVCTPDHRRRHSLNSNSIDNTDVTAMNTAGNNGSNGSNGSTVGSSSSGNGGSSNGRPILRSSSGNNISSSSSNGDHMGVGMGIGNIGNHIGGGISGNQSYMVLEQSSDHGGHGSEDSINDSFTAQNAIHNNNNHLNINHNSHSNINNNSTTNSNSSSIGSNNNLDFHDKERSSIHFTELDIEEDSFDPLDLDPSPIDVDIILPIFSMGFLREAFSMLDYRGKPVNSTCTCRESRENNRENRENNQSNQNGYVSATINPISSLSHISPVSVTDRSDHSNTHNNINNNSSHIIRNNRLEKHKESKDRPPIHRRKQFKYTHTDMLSIAIILCPLWFIANCCYNYALLYTSVASSTVISNLSGGFTLFFSWLYGIEKITISKLVGLTICFIGVGMVAMADDAARDQSTVSSMSVIGDLMAVLGAMGYGLYTTVLRVKVVDDDSASMQLLLGYMGLVNALILSPILLVMALMDWGNVRQLTLTAFGYIFLSGFFDDVISDYLWARSVLLTSPTVATVGLTLTIPMAIFVDYFSESSGSVGVMSVLGAVCVLWGFLVVTADCTEKVSVRTDRQTQEN